MSSYPPPGKRYVQRLALSLAGLAAAVMFTLVACKKETAEISIPAAVGEHDLEPRIRAFVERATDGARDGGTIISADSAEWYVEAALNFGNADLSIEYNSAQVDSLSYTIPLDNGMAKEFDAIAAYNTLDPTVAESNVPDLSHVAVVDVTSQNTVDGLVLTVAYVVGSGYEKNINVTYGVNDWWMWMGNGNCNCRNPPLNPPPGNNGLCADKRIQQRMQQAINNGQYVYMVSIETWNLVPYGTSIPDKEISYMDFPIGGSPYGYRTYGCSGPGCSTCLSPTHMTFFTQGTWDVMNMIRQQHCPTKTRLGATVTGDLSTCTGCPTHSFHWIQYRYGIIPRS